uniref:Rab-GAP TBC domain-containing protein n=1 Tax=Syphacia muris TaxID=451379 RepID=A0A0N5ABQ2_9BILA
MKSSDVRYSPADSSLARCVITDVFELACEYVRNNVPQSKPIIMDSEGPPARLLRSNPRSSSIGSRLSFALRRSMRLSPKRSTTYGLAESISREVSHETEKHDGSQKETTSTRAGNFFTENAAIKIETFSKRYGTLGELSRLLQLARKTPIKKFLRYNDWPLGHNIRQDLWKELCRDRDYDANLKLYKTEVEELSHKGQNLGSIRAAFVMAPGSVINNYELNNDGKIALQRLLLVIECVRPDITFVPVSYLFLLF